MKLKKNLLILFVMILCIISMYFTMDHASKNSISNDFEQNMQMPQGNVQPGGIQHPQDDMNFPGNMQMPQGNMQMPGMNGNMQQMSPNQNNQMRQRNSLSTGYFVLLIVEGTVLSLCVIYLFMSKFNALTFNETFVNKDKIIICILSAILLTEGVIVTNLFIYNNFFNRSQTPIVEEDEEYDEIDYGVVVKDEMVDLSQYDSNITLKGAKEYTLTGEFNHSVFVDSDSKVTVNLNNVTIKSSKTAAIANINTNEFVVCLEEGTVNKLTDGGYSEYDGCLYSNGHLTIEGNGTLYVNGKQDEGEGTTTTDQDITINSGMIYVESNDDGLNAGGDTGGMITINNGTVYVHASGDGIDSNNGLTINGGVVYSMGSAVGGDAGIDTDAGYNIHGGIVIGLGSDMLTPPTKDSKQASIALNLDQVIQEGTDVTILNEQDEVVVAFIADENFRTLVFSSETLARGTYSLYVNGKHSGETIASIYQETSYTKGEKIMNIEL